MPSWQQKATAAKPSARGFAAPRVVWDPGMYIHRLHSIALSHLKVMSGTTPGRPWAERSGKRVDPFALFLVAPLRANPPCGLGELDADA
jgi:hypothetical protein